MGKAYNWMCAGIAGSGSMLYGYDAAVIAGTLAQPGFLEYFNPSATVLGAVGSVYFAGLLIGLLFVSALADRFGRKRTIQFGAAVGLIGAVFQTAAHEIGLFFTGRVLAGIASGIMLTTVNVYQAEIAPPDLRGTMVAFQIVTLNLAGALASWVGFACNHSTNLSFQWRFPIGLQCLPAILLIIGCFFIPFSPRWLITKDRHAEAQVILKRLHDSHEDSTFWEKEYIQISAQLEVEAKEKETASWTHMLTNWSELRRLLVAIAALTSVQTNGAQTIQVYQSVFYAGLGFSTTQVLLMVGVFAICNTCGGVTNLILIDRVGRRKLFLSGLVILSVMLGVFAACSERYTSTGTKSWGKAGVGFVMVYIYFFGATYASSPYAYAAEILPTKNRANGVAIALFVANSVTLTFTQVTPIALDKIAWKFNIVFIACNLFFLPIVYFFFPETKGLSLEEVNGAFGERVEVEFKDITENEVEKVAVVQLEDTHEVKV
ncbi:general substrate transporter [Mytilinidion resinicola]|uniref:General substrate transporter n=1 Tax=Mytilinidion resinicola TaxID=574789 RepID=A0A6A6Y1N0_9PEZI|nr:general substrate transporter [Mytilinidion resinicola]KAF2802682.1 general substrate transporter [Mytilinidion resinicola]